ncbi:hypothetical protein ACWERY_06080 [Streptomyces sp. NPDC004082]|uniref:hypothetical protein n=1 Tax=Streptomyces sp. NPDC005301 TaxID=3156874 RepID=UPI0033BBF101
MPPGLTADWALWGKEPGTNSGYQVLAACPRERSAEFNTSVHHWSPGTPARGDQLPWITIGPGRAPDGTDTVGVFLLDGTGTVDRTNRPIYRIVHFAVDAATVGELGLSWHALAEAALETAPSLPTPHGEPAQLFVEDNSRFLERARSVFTDRITTGSDWLAAAAAYLLDGTVVVTEDRNYKPLELLHVLDCVVAMLPAGVRRSLSAATGSSSGSQVPMRLYWGADDGSPGVRCLAWGGGLPDLDGLSPAARSYFDLLVRAWQVHGGERVVAHLAGSRGLLDIDSAHVHADALHILSRLNPGLALAQEVRQGRAVDNERIDEALRHDVFDPASVAVLSQAKLAGLSTDLGSMARHLPQPEVSEAFWNQIVDDLLAGSVDSARSRFESVRQETPDTREGRRPLDRALASVVDEVRRHAATGSQDPVVDQLLPTIDPFTPGTMEFTQSQLRTLPGLAARLVDAVCAEPDPAPRVLAWLRWLGDDSAPELAGNPELALLYHLLESGSTRSELSKKWTEAHPQSAARLLAAAGACGHADDVLGNGYFHGLVSCALRNSPASPSGDCARTLLQRALERPPYGARAETAARWDVLCALTGRLPAAFVALARAPELPGSAGISTRLTGYASTLHAELEAPALRAHVHTIVDGLLKEVLAVDEDTGKGPADTGRDLTVRLLERPGPHVPAVIEAVERLTQQPHWDETEQDAHWLARIAERRPELAAALSLRTLHRAARQAGDTPEDCKALAAQLYTARREGAGHDQLYVPLCFWARRGLTGERVLDVLLAYRDVWESYGGRSRADDEHSLLERALRRGPDTELWDAYLLYAIGFLKRRSATYARQMQELIGKQRRNEDEIGRLRRLDAGLSHSRP